MAYVVLNSEATGEVGKLKGIQINLDTCTLVNNE